MAKENKELQISEPQMVKSHDVMLDAEYAEWIAEVKHRSSEGCRKGEWQESVIKLQQLVGEILHQADAELSEGWNCFRRNLEPLSD